MTVCHWLLNITLQCHWCMLIFPSCSQWQTASTGILFTENRMHADNWCGCFASQCGIEPWTSNVLWPDLGCLWWLALWLLNCSSQFCNILKGGSYALSASDCVAKLSVTDTISQSACTNEVTPLLNAWGHTSFECPLSANSCLPEGSCWLYMNEREEYSSLYIFQTCEHHLTFVRLYVSGWSFLSPGDSLRLCLCRSIILSLEVGLASPRNVNSCKKSSS